MQKKMVVSLAAASFSLLTSAAFAENSEKCGCWYVGAGVGQSRVSIDDVPPVAGITFTQSKDEHDTGWKLFAGYNWSPNFAIEGGWVDLGKFNQSITFTAPAIGSASVDIKAQGIFLDAVGILPLNESFSLFGKVGGIYAHSSTDVSLTGPIAPVAAAAGVAGDSDDKLKATAGLGAQYDFTRNFGVRAEWERYFKLGTDNSGKGDIDLFSVSGVYTFY